MSLWRFVEAPTIEAFLLEASGWRRSASSQTLLARDSSVVARIDGRYGGKERDDTGIEEGQEVSSRVCVEAESVASLTGSTNRW